MKTRYFISTALALVAISFSACQSFVQNLTPSRIEANASNIYTFRVRVDERQRNMIKDTLRVDIVIDGKTHPMHRDLQLGDRIWMYESEVPSNVADVPYYFVIHYRGRTDGNFVDQIVYSTDFTPEHAPYTSRIVNRYVAQLSSTRSPVGATLSIMGQGFSEFDRVVVGQIEAPTTFISTSLLNFTIPPIPAGQTYMVHVRTGEGDLDAGLLRIDASTIGVQPTSLSIGVGESVPLTFFIEGSAPTGGLKIDVTTEISASIAMPEVVIPAGQRSVSVTVQGLSAADGFLWISAEGYQESKLPVSIH